MIEALCNEKIASLPLLGFLYTQQIGMPVRRKLAQLIELRQFILRIEFPTQSIHFLFAFTISVQITFFTEFICYIQQSWLVTCFIPDKN